MQFCDGLMADRSILPPVSHFVFRHCLMFFVFALVVDVFFARLCLVDLNAAPSTSECSSSNVIATGGSVDGLAPIDAVSGSTPWKQRYARSVIYSLL